MINKRKSITTIITVIIIAIVFTFIIIKHGYGSNKITLEIFNQTSRPISGLKLTYTNIEKDVKIPTIKPNKSVGISVIAKENFSENSLRIKYLDKDKIERTETVVGYFEKVNDKITPKIDTKVYITSSDSNGILKLKIKK